MTEQGLATRLPKVCGNCGRTAYPEGRDKGTVACQRDNTIKNKYDQACDGWEWPSWLPKPTTVADQIAPQGLTTVNQVRYNESEGEHIDIKLVGTQSSNSQEVMG